MSPIAHIASGLRTNRPLKVLQIASADCDTSSGQRYRVTGCDFEHTGLYDKTAWLASISVSVRTMRGLSQCASKVAYILYLYSSITHFIIQLL